MLSSLKKSVTPLIERLYEWRANRRLESREKRLCLKNNILSKGDDFKCNYQTWKQYWKPIAKFNSPWAYKLYCHYAGHGKHIISEPACVELNRSLNPEEYQPYYLDKNMFDKILPKGFLPQTILRVINGELFDADYNTLPNFNESDLRDLLKQYSKVIMKPSVDSNSGKGVQLFNLTAGYNPDLTLEKILSYGNNLIIQEALEQHPDLARFNPSSINTLRLATYRSPYTGKAYVLSAVIRIGKSGSHLDNLHAGGMMVAIDIKTGILSNKCFNADGESFTSHNGIDFSKNEFFIPFWNSVIEFAKTVAKSVPHLHLLQHDITVDPKGIVRTIEYNGNGFAQWVAQFSGIPAFGEHYEEMRRYALSRKHSVKIVQQRK